MNAIDLGKMNQTVEAVSLGGANYWTHGKRRKAYKELDARLCSLYGLEPSKIVHTHNVPVPGALGVNAGKTIYLGRWSLVTYLHEFYHRVVGADEMTCRIVSNFLYIAAYPEKASNAVLVQGVVKTKTDFASACPDGRVV
jgi:hypothetical protein